MSLTSTFVPPLNQGKAEHLLIALHGWGANAQDLAPLAPVFNLPNYQFVFPDAPFPHSQVPGGRAWYALDTENYTGIEESRERLCEWILSLEQTTGVPLERTILSGFSQGGAMALDVGLNYALPLAGLCCLSGYLHFHPCKTNQPMPPILIAHGKWDYVVLIAAAQNAQRELKEIGARVEYQEFDMGHEITPPVLAFMEKFILGLDNC